MNENVGFSPYMNLSIEAKKAGGPDKFIKQIYDSGVIVGTDKTLIIVATINACGSLLYKLVDYCNKRKLMKGE